MSLFAIRAVRWRRMVELKLYQCVLKIVRFVAGTIMVTIADDSKGDGQTSVLGDALCLFSGIFYACYTIFIKKLVTSHCQVCSQRGNVPLGACTLDIFPYFKQMLFMNMTCR